MDNKNKAHRRPAGFGSVTGRKPVREVSRPEPKPEKKQAVQKPKRKKQEREWDAEKKPFPVKAVLITLALVAIVLVVILLGGRKTNIHALPTIVRENSTATPAPNGDTTAAPEATALFEDSVTPDPAALSGEVNFEPEVTVIPEVTE